MTKENIGIILGIIGAVGAIPVFKGYFLGALIYNNSRKLSKLRKERDLFIELKSSDRALTLYLLMGIIVNFAILGVSLLFHGMQTYPGDMSFNGVSDLSFGFVIYMYSVNRLGKINRLKRFDKTIELLDVQIAKLEGKLQVGAKLRIDD